MNKIRILIFLLVICNTSFGQYKLVPNTSEFKSLFTTAYTKTNTIASDFIQVKTLTLLADKITSRGKFYFQKDNKLRMEYISPYPYLMVINGNKVSVKDGQKTSTMSARSNKLFQRMNQLMMDCMRGSVFDNKDFSVRLFEDNDTYLAEMTPVNSQMGGLFKKVNVILKKANFMVTQVQMFEPAGDYTSIQYNNQKLNTNLPDALFAVR